MYKKVYGGLPKVFKYYTAKYRYVLSPEHLFQLTTHLAWRGKLYYGWTRKILSFIDSIPPSYLLPNSRGDQKDFNDIIEEIFNMVIDDEDYLSEFFGAVFKGIDHDWELVSVDLEERGEFKLEFKSPVREI